MLLTQAEIDAKIHDFLRRKDRKYPELKDSWRDLESSKALHKGQTPVLRGQYKSLAF